jgi:hypothetical protein
VQKMNELKECEAELEKLASSLAHEIGVVL